MCPALLNQVHIQWNHAVKAILYKILPTPTPLIGTHSSVSITPSQFNVPPITVNRLEQETSITTDTVTATVQEPPILETLTKN